MGIFDEPRPIEGARPPAKSWPPFERVLPLTRQILAPSDRFFDVLARRHSVVGGSVDERELSSLLWHVMLLRERNSSSRFGVWESRAAPSAGGLHSVGIACLPLDATPLCGFYEPEGHLLHCSKAFEGALSVNRKEIGKLLGTREGVTLQFVGDRLRYEACYLNWETLFWRDVGVLLGLVALTASALGLAAVPVGRVGDNVLATAGFGPRYVAGGAIHICSLDG